MNPQEKMAWYMLAVIVLAVVLFAVLFNLSGRLMTSMSAFGLLGLLGI